MRHLDLFSGIGGFALAARWVGIETVAFCEIEEFPRKVLAKNFPGITIHPDIRDLDGSKYEGIDLITGGYPCQPFSVAGKRKGTEDDRHLWPEMRRVIAQARPAWVVCENVVGHITMGLDQVLTDLEADGYASRAFVIPACAKDASHQRDRVWIIGHSDGVDATGSKRPGRSDICTEKRNIAQGKQERRDRIVKLEPRAVTPRPATYTRALRELDGIPDRVDRLKSLGNAIVPQVAYEILRNIKAL